jgi:ABC-2 type transport system ATP-binding protein
VVIVEVRDLLKAYSTKIALKDISFDLEKGSCLAVLGPNGAGKTTLVEILEGYKKPDSGVVTVMGKAPRDFKTSDLAKVGILLQETAIEPFLKVKEVIAQRQRFLKESMPLSEVLDLIGLQDAANQYVSKLSGGQKRKLDFALAIMGYPEIVFLDEPTVGFDPEARKQTWAIIESLKKDKRTIILTTHYLQEAEALADKILILSGGKEVVFKDKKDLNSEIKTSYIIEFVLPTNSFLNVLNRFNFKINDAVVKLEVEDPTELLYELAKFSKQNGSKIKGLKVIPIGLEEIYFRLLEENDGKIN